MKGLFRKDHSEHLLKLPRVFFVKGIGLVTINVENTKQRTAAIMDRQNQLGPRAAGTGNMTRKCIDIGHKLHLTGAAAAPQTPRSKGITRQPWPP